MVTRCGDLERNTAALLKFETYRVHLRDCNCTRWRETLIQYRSKRHGWDWHLIPEKKWAKKKTILINAFMQAMNSQRSMRPIYSCFAIHAAIQKEQVSLECNGDTKARRRFTSYAAIYRRNRTRQHSGREPGGSRMKKREYEKLRKGD